MPGSEVPTSRPRSTTQFFALAKSVLSLDVPEALTNLQIIPRLDDPDPAVIAAITEVRTIRTAAVLVPIVDHPEPTVLFTERPSHLRDHAGQIAFPGGKIEALDLTPVGAALREVEEEVGLDKRFIEPIGYLDVHVTPSGFRILPVLARVREGFSLRIESGEVAAAFELPLAFLMAPQNYRRETAQWNALPTSVYSISFNGRRIWGVTASILRNLWERTYAG
ncbi:CoA pyrophosphatase [Bradyrhizobium cytisi]|uniref:CoA pyrophosphatase n=1 Tax=Bradyrhizobium cytisi TaxID=515489 RepID=A0A5S4WHG9_9BRAD|nr:CoA pyrophosphatase [Bradyrhizobium cytisi]TYL80832.1 CoA pyrophosphatase [Bradyrhizobium cytisi]